LTRSFGFLAVATQQEAIRLSGKHYIVADDVIEAKLSDSATILLHQVDAYLINAHHKAILTNKVIESNWLNSMSVTTERETIKVTIYQKPLTSQRLQSIIVRPAHTPPVALPCATISEKPVELVMVSAPTSTNLDDDSLIINLNDNEKFLEEPCCSRTLIDVNKADKIAYDELRERPTAILEEAPAKKKAKSQWKTQRCKFIILRMEGKYPRFSDFQEDIINYSKCHQWILFIEKENSSTVYMEFNNEKDASKFKDIMEGVNTHGRCEVSYSTTTANTVLQKAIKRELKPAFPAESMFLINKERDIIQCRYKRNWQKLNFPSPQFVANSDK